MVRGMTANSGSGELTSAELAVLAAIKTRIAQDGCAPTVRELTTALGYRWPQSVQRRIERLVEAGVLHRGRGQRTLVPVTGRAHAGDGKPVRRLAQRMGAGPGSDPAPDDMAALIRPNEECVRIVLARAVRGGPAAGDVLYCVAGRRVRADDLLAFRDSSGAVLAERGTTRERVQKHGGEIIGVVLGWLHRTR
jgi:hypothetical protein